MRAFLSALVVVGLWCVSTTATEAATRLVKFNIRGNKPLIVPMTLASPTLLTFPSEVKAAGTEQPRGAAEVRFVKHSHEVQVELHEGARNGPLTVITASHTLDITLLIVDRSEQALDRVEFFDGHQVERELLAACDARQDEVVSAAGFKGIETKTLGLATVAGDDAVKVLDPILMTVGDRHLFGFWLTQDRYATLPLQTIRVFDEDRASEHTRYVHVLVDGKPQDARNLAELPRGKRVRVNVGFDDIEHFGSFAYLEIVARGGLAVVTKRFDFYDKEPPRPPPRSVGKLALGVAGFWGRAQLAGAADWTPLRGGGVVASYGILRWLSVEGSISVFDTDQAAELGGATGAAVRAAALVHFGDTWVPFFRLGITPAVFRQDSHTRGTLLSTVGVGCQRWLGDHWVATLSASYARESEVLDLAQLSFHLAYSWPL